MFCCCLLLLVVLTKCGIGLIGFDCYVAVGRPLSYFLSFGFKYSCANYTGLWFVLVFRWWLTGWIQFLEVVRVNVFMSVYFDVLVTVLTLCRNYLLTSIDDDDALMFSSCPRKKRPRS